MEQNNHNQASKSEDKINEAYSENINEAGIDDLAPDAETIEEAETESEVNILEKKVADLEAQVAKEKKEYLFLMAEFDNFRKRTLKEKSEIIKNAGENVFKGILPIMDDFERAIKASENETDASAIKEGTILIYNKLKKYLQQNGVKEFDASETDFDADRHEAISVVPVPDEAMKGKILDTVEKGYTINDKVLRHAKVVVGQ